MEEDTVKIETKQCNTCKNIKLHSEFYRIKRTTISRTYWAISGSCKNCRGSKIAKWYRNNVDKRRKYSRERNREIKKEILIEYSDNGTAACSCCEEEHIEFLTLDHIDGNGTKHRKLLGAVGGSSLYRKLKKLNFPDKDKMRILCINCNSSIGLYGYCPHKERNTLKC